MTGTKTLRLFSTPVLVKEIAEASALNAELERTILQRRDQDPGVRRSNVGGWHSKPDLLRWAGESAQMIAREATALAVANTTTANGGPTAIRWRVEAWANVSGSGDLNQPHVHGGCFWSAVYYVRADDGEGGHLVLHDPRMPALRMNNPRLRFKDAGPEQIARIKPKPGMLVMLPSWLSHGVDPWQGDGLRISIALNLIPVQAPVPRRVIEQIPEDTQLH